MPFVEPLPASRDSPGQRRPSVFPRYDASDGRLHADEGGIDTWHADSGGVTREPSGRKARVGREYALRPSLPASACDEFACVRACVVRVPSVLCVPLR